MRVWTYCAITAFAALDVAAAATASRVVGARVHVDGGWWLSDKMARSVLSELVIKIEEESSAQKVKQSSRCLFKGRKSPCRREAV